MKIDLHCHTRKIKEGDPDTREVSNDIFVESVLSAGVKIVAITNHNAFDIEQYRSFVLGAKDDFQVWPGIELDVKGETKNGHVVIVNNPNTVDIFNEKVNLLINSINPNEFLINVEDLVTFFNGLDAIILPHYYKPKSLDENSINKIKELINEKHSFFYEPSSYRTMGILINHNQPSLVGSDVKDWAQYDKNVFSELKLDVDTFDQFLLLAKKDPALVDTLLHKKRQTIIDIGYKGTGKNKEKSLTELVPIYDDVNIIFGTKGTGKSNVLEQIKKYYTSKNINFSYYTPNSTDDEINSKLKVLDFERTLKQHSLENYSKDFASLCVWEESSVTQLKDFIDYAICTKTNKNKEKLKILNTNIYLNVDEKNIVKQKNNSSYLCQIYNNLNLIEADKYISTDEFDTLHVILNKLNININKCLRDEWINYETEKYSNFMIEKIKSIVEENTETKTRPSKTGLFDFVNKRLELIIGINKICTGFDYDFSSSPVKVGKLEESKILYIVTKFKMLDLKSKTEEFTHNITKLKETKDRLFLVKSKLFDVNISEAMGELNEAIVNYNISSLDDFMGVKKIFTLNSENSEDVVEYIPSTGEATMIILQEKLNDDKDVFILDEPEKSLGNTYVNDIIVPKLMGLAKARKVVIVVTHNANIAVRTFPYTSILKTYTQGKYQTFLGNPFSNYLKLIDSPTEKLNWKNESVKILEGGIDAFEERGEIYGRK